MPIYYCQLCEYDAKGHRGNFNKHLKTKKHRIASQKKPEKSTVEIRDKSMVEIIKEIDIILQM